MNIDKISSVQNVLHSKVQNKHNAQQIPTEQLNENYSTPSSQHYIGYQPNFTGGYSLDLGETVSRLDKLVSKYPDLYPKNVREWAGMILEEGNKTKDTLISIHRKLYENIKDCFSLSELKAKFPEFEGVKSANDVEYKKGSLLEDLLSGKIEEFNTDEDLTLQLIKLYWGEGFSLNDLSQYAGGRNLSYVMDKLGIPKVNQHYGHILKFSDPEYNARLTKQMTEKRMQTLDMKAQQQEGEPVYIPSKREGRPLSEEHKKHISEGLLRSYRENPERAFNMSERQKQYYRENPEQADIFHRVLLKTWHAAGAEDIRKALARYLRTHKLPDATIDEISSPEKLSKGRSDIMRKFWADNPWANKRFSKYMEYAWKKVKEEQDMFYVIELTPRTFKRRFMEWCEKEGLDTSKLNLDCFKYYPHHPELNVEPPEAKIINFYTPRYIDSCEGDESQKLANSLQQTLIKFGHYLKSYEKSPLATTDTKSLAVMLRRFIHNCIFDSEKTLIGLPNARVLDANEVQSIYSSTMTMLMDKHENKMIKELVKLMNESYDHLDRTWKPGRPILLPRDAHEF